MWGSWPRLLAVSLLSPYSVGKRRVPGEAAVPKAANCNTFVVGRTAAGISAREGAEDTYIGTGAVGKVALGYPFERTSISVFCRWAPKGRPTHSNLIPQARTPARHSLPFN